MANSRVSSSIRVVARWETIEASIFLLCVERERAEASLSSKIWGKVQSSIVSHLATTRILLFTLELHQFFFAIFFHFYSTVGLNLRPLFRQNLGRKLLTVRIHWSISFDTKSILLECSHYNIQGLCIFDLFLKFNSINV